MPPVQRSKLHLRAARPEDEGVVFELFAQVQAIHAVAEPEFFRKPAKDEVFDQFFSDVLEDPEQHLILASIDRTTIGYVQYFLGTRPENLFRVAQRLAYINQLIVADGFRKTGCGTLLIDHVKQVSKSNSIGLIGIDCWSFNQAAQACFAKSGFACNRQHMWLRL